MFEVTRSDKLSNSCCLNRGSVLLYEEVFDSFLNDHIGTPMPVLGNSPVSQYFPPSGEQPEQSLLSLKSEQPTATCIAILDKYCCYVKHGGITEKLAL